MTASSPKPVLNGLRDAVIVTAIAFALAVPLIGFRTIDNAEGLTLETRFGHVLTGCALVFLGRIAVLALRGKGAGAVLPGSLVMLAASFITPWPAPFLKFIATAGSGILVLMAVRHIVQGNSPQPFSAMAGQAAKLRRAMPFMMPALIALGAVMPFLPVADRYVMDVGIMVLTYITLAWGLNIVVGYAGLLDLGYVAFYAIGAYTYALLAQAFGFSFWMALPIAGGLAALVACLIGLPVLRLRGDYLAIVTLGFSEITRLILINWTELTGGPNGVSGIPRPSFFGLDFARSSDGVPTFHEFFGLDFNPMQRVVFLYYMIFALALLTGWFACRIRKLPLGRAWEASREDEIACNALGVNLTAVRLAAYVCGALIAGLAGAFFATRQGFISPESFTFMETVTVLSIIVLGGMGNQLGIILATLFIIGLPELFRDLESYRMIAFGAGMVLIMIWRPTGLMGTREPGIKLN